MGQTGKWKILNALDLKIMAMVLMFCDHLWATLLPSQQWLTNVGRLAFPIFAFQVVEGYFHTHDFKTYLKRMFLFALLSEIPFNLMTAGGLMNPFHQNVMFTFCLGLLLIRMIEKLQKKSTPVFFLGTVGVAVLGYILGTILFLDYYGCGILMILVFYFFRNIPHGWVGILAAMILINGEVMGGLTYPVTVFGHSFDFYQQSFAVLALIPIGLYNGRQGPHNKWIQYGCYAFYPVHMLLLALVWLALV